MILSGMQTPMREVNWEQVMNDYIVKDINLVNFGRKELAIVESELPSWMAFRSEYGESEPLKTHSRLSTTNTEKAFK